MLHCIFQTAECLEAKAVTGYADHKEIVGSFVENEFNWYTGIGTTEYCCKRALFRCPCDVGIEAQISCVDRDNSLYPAFFIDMIDKRGEVRVTCVQPAQGRIAVVW